MPKDDATLREIAPDIPDGLQFGLRNYWYPVLQSEDVGRDKPVGFLLLGEALACWRDGDGRPRVLADRCPHRAAKLSVGRVLDGQLQCVFHGLRFGGDGRCTLIPLEPETSPLLREITAPAYPTDELGGYIWAYIGDAAKFPPPPLRDEAPAELSRPDEFVWFKLKTEVWNANWLLAVDGGDAYHAVTLHAGSQAVADKTWQGGRAEAAAATLAERRIKIVETAGHGLRGVATDRAGKPIHHGHFTAAIKGDRFVLPCITTNPITPAPGAAPYAARLWQIPIDDKRTLIQRFLSWPARTAEERARAERIFNDIALPRLQAISIEDAAMAEAQGELISARTGEFLLSPDRDLVRLRRLLKHAFVAQVGGQRDAPPPGSLVHPV
jgi:phenylpropionate dioxygenase-like ring-hydroxylating dioxygenase large terminal subunit